MQKCKTEEKLPAEIVHELDFYDNGDKKNSPQFKCDGHMIPIKYHIFHSIFLASIDKNIGWIISILEMVTAINSYIISLIATLKSGIIE